ncbi:MAG TPA: serine/threonine-protein kinase [Gemmataceae bacterium]|nr:serine/threonine-protein kinase [Gemmataceae bacterium]
MDNLSAVESIFFAALEKVSAEERAAYLDQACGQDAPLRRHVENLLSAHPKAGAFLQRPCFGPVPTTDEPVVTERPGTVIGPYKLMEQIGAGGMGLVFVAEQQHPVRRKVALKVVKPGMDTHDVIARFEAERQALALMDHPNIAKVLDAGATESGRPYFVMELVKGVPITDFCDRNQLTPREQLELFTAVCQAVQHAHSKGVIHRDIKPSNVLVTLHDGAPVVKVIDFGVAKAVGQSLTDKTVYTRFAQMIGTPLYMSPEQAEMAGLDVDTRCDVYALGVLLFELLTGTTPFDGQRLQKAALDEVRRILREEEPPKLSTLGDGLSAVSARRKTEPKKLSALVKGDLDWIVMKALEKDRNRRYETASAFAADVRRYLGEEAVEACPPSALYRFVKMARRNRVVLTTAALVAAALVVETIVSVCLALVAWRAEGKALDATTYALKAKANSDENARLANERKTQVEILAKGVEQALYDADLESIPAAWEADDLASFDQLLERQVNGRHVGDPRGFEWYYWNRQRHGEMRSVALAGVSHELLSPTTFSPGGKFIAAVVRVEGRGEVRLWDTATGAARRTLLTIPDYGEGLNAPRARIAFSPDGGRIALSRLSFGRLVNPTEVLLYRIPDVLHLDIHVWDVHKSDELCHISLDRGGGRFDALAFGPQGKLLAFIAPQAPGQPPSGNVRVWDADAGKEAYSLSAPGTPRELAFSPDGGRIALALSKEGGTEGIPDQKNLVQIWDTATRQELLTIPKRGTVVTGPMASHDGAPPPPPPPPWLGSLPNGVAFSPDGKRLAVVWQGQKDDVLTVHEIAKAGEVRTMEGVVKAKEISLQPPAFSADGRSLTCPVSGSLVRVWDPGTGVVRYTARGHVATPAVAFTGDGRLLTAGREGTVKEWSAPTARAQPADLNGSSNYSPLAAAFTPQGLRLARAFLIEDGDKRSLELRAWDEHGGAFVLLKTPFPMNKVQHLVFNKDATLLAADYIAPDTTVDKPHLVLKVWDAASGKELLTADSGDIISGLAVSPQGARVAWVTAGRMRVLDAASGKQLLDVPEPWSLSLFPSFNTDGSRLAWTGERRVHVWDVDAAREVFAVRDPGGDVGPLALSADGGRLAAAVGPVWGVFDEVKVWNVADGRELMSAKGQRLVQDLAFNPDGSRLASFRWQHDAEGDHGGVTVWDAAAGLPVLRISVPAGYGGGGQLRFQSDGRRLFLFNQFPPSQGDAFEVWDATPTAADKPGP